MTLHRVWKLGDNIDTDVLAPGQAMKFGMDALKADCLSRVRPEFASQVRAGDVILAGPGFGIGSSREQAASVLVALGVSAVIAPDFGGLYFRNAFNVGLLLLTADLTEVVADGDHIELDVQPGEVPVITDGQQGRHVCAAIPEFLLNRVACGGLMPELKQMLKKADHV